MKQPRPHWQSQCQSCGHAADTHYEGRGRQRRLRTRFGLTPCAGYTRDLALCGCPRYVVAQHRKRNRKR